MKKYVLPSKTIQADLDHADTNTLPVLPTLLVETSPTRHQAFWVLERELETEKLEEHARRIAYGIPDCDHTGWPAGKKVRMPHTYNYKYTSRHLVEVVGVSLRELKLDTFNNFPALEVSIERANDDVEWIDNEPTFLDTDLMALLKDVKPILPARVFTQYTKPAKDRSAALWAFNTECLKAGLTREQTYFLATHNANNKFADRPSGERDLRKDILRAETRLETRQVDLKNVIMDLRYKGQKQAVERHKDIATVVLNHMREKGEFVHAASGLLWYLRKDTGRPIVLTMHSEWLIAYLNSTFGLNFSEALTKYVVYDLQAYCRAIPESADLQSLSYYDDFTKKLLIHTGGRDVLHIGADSIEVHPNGYGSVVFKWQSGAEVFMLDKSELTSTWYEFIFSQQLDNLVNLTKEEGLQVLRAWVLFLLFRKMATIRPLIAFLGQPGSGKTTSAKKLYRLIYGRYKSISGLSEPVDFDMLAYAMPFVAYDNADDWRPWLPDRLALSTSDTDVEKRMLYTDLDLVTLKRQALIMLTAHNPRFTREDVMDRMIVLMFSRLPTFGNETALLEEISIRRNMLWSEIVKDVQKILATPKPSVDDSPDFRIKDFSYLGVWFSRALGPEHEQVFRQAIDKLRGAQRSFNLDQDQMLVAALTSYVSKHANTGDENEGYVKSDTLHAMIMSCAKDPALFQRTYKTPIHLGKKLWVMQDSLKQLFDIKWKYDVNNISRLWRIAPKQESPPNA